MAAISQLRRALREAGGEYKIYKNTLVRFAARDLGLEIDELLTGPTAIAFVDGDAAAVAKALRDSARTNPHARRQGRPARHEGAQRGRSSQRWPICRRATCLLGQVAGAMAAPLQQFAGLLQALPRNFAYGLKALLDERGGAPGARSRAEAEARARSRSRARAERRARAEAPVSEAATETETETTEQTETPAAESAADTEES